jgi:ATP-dependent Lhr-like helicase
LLPARVAHYDPRWLDALCLSGAIGWGRVSPHPAWASGDGAAPRRVIPTNGAPITFYLRESADWLPHALAAQSIEPARLAAALSPEALQVRAILAQRGACFANDLQRLTGCTRQQTSHALWELAAAGIASADGFDQLRAMMDPRRKAAAQAPVQAPVSLNRRASARSNAGRWSLFLEPVQPAPAVRLTPAEVQQAAIEQARQTDRALESAARMLLCRYGILFRDLLQRESNTPKWRDLLPLLRRLEARGEVRGGRFVSGFSGEQFALPEAVESLRASRSQSSEIEIAVAAADPMNLADIVVPGGRIPAIPGRFVRFRNGCALPPEGAAAIHPTQTIPPPIPTSPAQPLNLF